MNKTQNSNKKKRGKKDRIYFLYQLQHREGRDGQKTDEGVLY